MTIQDIRSKIDSIDEQVLKLLNQRARLALEIGHLKAVDGRVPFVPAREIQLLERLQSLNKGPLPPTAVRAVYREIISACRNLERPISIAYWGPPATQTHLAAIQQFGESADYEPVRTIADVFNAVETSRQDFGVVPVENSTAGSVQDTLDHFSDTSLTICAEVLLPVHFALLTTEESLAEIKRIYSIPIAVEQCRGWLADHLPNVEIIDAAPTSRAAQLASEEPNAAAIAGRLAAEIYQLNILYDRIEDSAHNTTRFLVIGHHSPDPSGRDKTSIMFAAPHRPGGLNAVLNCLQAHNINLTMINSRPTRRMPWEYLFYVDVQGHSQDPGLKEALDAMRSRCDFLRILGSYPESA